MLDTLDSTLKGETPRTEAPVLASVESEDMLTQFVRDFEESEDTCRESRQLAERDRDYYDNDQWTSEELRILRKRKQPALTINYIKRKVEFALGMERRVRSDPKAFPRNPDDEQTSEAATDSLRFVASQNDFDEVRSAVFENFYIEGTGGVDVIVTPKGEDYDIVYKRIQWDRLFWDPHSAEKDFSDAAYKGVVIWMDAKEAKRKWPEAVEALETTLTGAANETFADRPKYTWCDSKRERVRIVQIHRLWDGEWMVATFTKGGFLEEPVKSPYIDKDGNSCSSLIMRSRFIDRENNRYGDARSLISLQDEINKRRSKALHLMSVRQTYGNSTATTDTQALKTELAKPDGHAALNGGAKFGEDFGILPTGDMAQGQVLLLQQAVSEMQLSGPNQALAGKGTQGQSGRAIEAQQQGGSVEMEPGLDDLRQWSRDVYEATWMRVRQFWTGPKWVRVTDDERNIKFVGLNKQVTLGDKLKELGRENPEEAKALAQQLGIQSPYDPKLQEVVEVQNEVSGLDVDIVIEEGPDITTLQSEQFEMLANLAKSGIQIPPKAIIQASSIRNKDQILDELEKGQQLPPEVQQKMQEMEQALQEANQKLQMQDVQLANREGELLLKNRELDIKTADAETKRISVTKQDAPEQGESQLEATQAVADIEQTDAETQKILVETDLLVHNALNPPQEVAE